MRRSPRCALLLAGLLLAAGCSSSTPAAAPTTPAAGAPKPTTVTAQSASAAPAVSPAAPPPSTAKPATSPTLLPSPSVAASLVPSPTPAAAAQPATAAGSLKGVCPDTVVFQTNWWPEPDYGFLYQLIGPNGTIDTNKNVYTGPLGDTGVNAEIRAGGPAIGFQQVTAQMYADDSIMLGVLGTDESIGNSANEPVKAIFAWYAKNPLILFWGNPDWNFQSIADIGKSDATVLVFQGGSWVQVLIGKGLLNGNNVDTSYTGDPARFVAADGSIVSQGFITSEPYIYEHEVQAWMKPVKFLLLDNDVPNYQGVAIRGDKLDANRACLQKLVPLMQQAAIDYVRNPGPVNGLIVDYTSKIKGGTQISAAGAADAVERMISQGLVGNGTDGVYGSYDTARVQSLIEDYGPVFASRGKTLKPGLQPSDLVTNEFLDKNIKL